MYGYLNLNYKPKSSSPKSSPEPTNAKKARQEPEPNESLKISTKARKIKVKGAEPPRNLLC
jgi:hypothetical protein